MTAQRLFERLDRMPMLKAATLLIAGIALSEAGTLPLWFLTGAFVCSGVLSLLLRSSLCTATMLLTAGFATAQLRAQEPATPIGVQTTYRIQIEGIPSHRGRYTSAEGCVEAWRDPFDGAWHAARDRILLRSDSLTPLHPGERMMCRGSIRPLRGGAESYRALMRRRGFAGTLFLRENTILERLPDEAHTLHTRASERLRRLGVQGDAGAVTRAMVTADRSGITPELRAAYSRSGFSHLLAVSGLHTGIVFSLLNLALWWLPLLRRGHLVRHAAVVAGVWLFVAGAGFPPSAVRAAVMCTLLQAALASASEYVAMNALSAAAFGMLLWNPAWLFDISFQLSFLAVGAILAWGVPLCRRLRTGRKALDSVVSALAISLTASAVTLPLVSHTFGIIPLAGILLNPVAILLATVTVFGGTLWLIVPLSPLAPLLRFATEQSAATLNALTRFTASIPCGSVEYSLGARPTAAIYLFFAASTLAAWSRKTKKSVHLPT